MHRHGDQSEQRNQSWQRGAHGATGARGSCNCVTPPPHAAVRACRSSLGDALPLGLRAEIRHHVFKKKYKKRVFFCCVSHRDPCVFVARLLHLLSHTIPSPCAIEPHA